MNNEFGEALKSFRLRNGWSQAQLADKIENYTKVKRQTHSYISRLELGKRKPSLEYLKILIAVLELTETERLYFFSVAGYSTERIELPPHLVKLYENLTNPLLDASIRQYTDSTILALCQLTDGAIRPPVPNVATVRRGSGSKAIRQGKIQAL